MICPKCKYDYQDVEEDEIPQRVVVGIDDHFYKSYCRRGRKCPHCGFVAETIEKPTGDPYFKRMPQVELPKKRNHGKINYSKNKQRSKAR